MTRNILVVDDEPAKSLPLAHHLEAQGHAVRFVKSGATAIDALKAARPDLVICDLNMPDMSGYQVLEAVATYLNMHDMPFVLADEEWTPENWSRPAGGRTADCHISKPINAREVVAFVNRIFQYLETDTS